MKLIFCLVLLFVTIMSYGQFDEDYRPLSTLPDNQKKLTQRLKQQSKSHWQDLKGYDYYEDIGELYKSRTTYLIEQIEKKRFIFSDTLQRKLNSVFYALLDSNRLINLPKEFFVGKNHQPNALCYGEGSFMITTGLMSRLTSDDQLAFIMAHELAHYQLNHIRDKTVQLVSNRGLKKADREIRNILLGKSTMKGLQMLKVWNYQLSKFSRSMEQEADSLGLQIMWNAGFHPQASLEVIDILEKSDEPVAKLGDQLFDDLKFSKFPFQDHWTRPRLSIYQKDSEKSFIYDNDSIKTHPEFTDRSEKLSVQMSYLELDGRVQTKDVELLVNTSFFESIEGAIIHYHLDYALHTALQLKAQYPTNRYLVSTVAKIFILLYEARENRLFQYYVSPYTSHYSDELRLVNNFLYNIDKYEMMELAFYFMNKKGNFNVESQEHYHLLWEISGITKRPKFQQKVKAGYIKKFPEGKYLTSMK